MSGARNDTPAALDELPTPALCLDLAAFQDNAAWLATTLRDSGKQWRPQHAVVFEQAAKCELSAGAAGVACLSVEAAERLVEAGVEDVVVDCAPVGQHRVERLAELSGRSRLAVVCDHFVQVKALAEACSAQGTRCGVLVELEVGTGRSAARPGPDVLELAEAVQRLDGVELVGLSGTFEPLGQLAGRPAARTTDDALNVLTHCRRQLERRGLLCNRVSVRQSSPSPTVLRSDVVTEVRTAAAWQVVAGDGTEQPKSPGRSLTVLTTVVSRGLFDRATLDCGRRWLCFGPARHVVVDFPDVEVLAVDDGWCTVRLEGAAREWLIGQRVRLVVERCEETLALHDRLFVVQGEQVEAVWLRDA